MSDYRQSTASQEVLLGPFVDETDGKTPETALSIANTDIKIWKTGTTTLANKNSGGATHISGGYYYAVLDATDTDTVGPAVITCNMSGALPLPPHKIRILSSAVYDWLFGTTTDSAGTTTLLSRLSSTRAGYLDNLSAGAVATQSSLDAAVWAQTRFRFSMPEAVEKPESGSTTYRIGITTYNASGVLADCDSTPTVTGYASDGTSLALISPSPVGSVVRDDTGIYHFDLTVSSALTTPAYWRFVGTGTMSSASIGMSDYTWVVDDANPDFGLSDRTMLEDVLGYVENLPSDPASEGTVGGLNDISTADILAATADGVAVSKVLEMLVAFVSGKASVWSDAGVSTITYKKQDGTTTSFTCVASEADGTRATTGSLS